MSNIGEGIIAKRRSYAATVTHLTPPFMEAGLYEDLRPLRDRLNSFRNAAPGPVRAEHARTIRRMAESMDLHVDLGLDSGADWSEDDYFRLSNHVETIDGSKVVQGLLHTGAGMVGGRNGLHRRTDGARSDRLQPRWHGPHEGEGHERPARGPGVLRGALPRPGETGVRPPDCRRKRGCGPEGPCRTGGSRAGARLAAASRASIRCFGAQKLHARRGAAVRPGRRSAGTPRRDASGGVRGR